MKQLFAELLFIRKLVALNLAAAMEYRASFISQILGMFLNNGIYFLFWLLFFDRFDSVRGYELGDVYLLFAVVATGFGLGTMIAGNTGVNLATLIAQGRLDYYLVFPRTLVSHVVLSRMGITSIGDVTFGIVAFLFTGRTSLLEVSMFVMTVLLAALIVIGVGIVAGSLAFFMGNAQYASHHMVMSMITFGLYPNSLFTGIARLLLYTLIPAGFIGAMPVSIIQGQTTLLPALALAAAVIFSLAIGVFYLGIRRYESGSAINVNI